MELVSTFKDGHYPVTIEQWDNGKFRIKYGAQVKDGLTYGEAVSEYGACVFHSLACAGKLDNGE